MITPSVLQGVEPQKETMLRAFGCELIQKAGILLQVNAVSIATGQTLLHWFYQCKSLKEYNIRDVAPASTLLSGKLQENPRKIKDIVCVYDYLRFESEPTMAHAYNRDSEMQSKARIQEIEHNMLAEFGFHVNQFVVSPHCYVLQYIYALFRRIDEYSTHGIDHLAQRAWGYLNDCMRTTLCCQTTPGIIAAGCIYLASADVGIHLTKDSKWHQIFDASWDDIMQVRNALEDLYAMGKVYYVQA